MSTARLEAVPHATREATAAIALQPASLDIWDKKYRLKTKQGEALDADIEATYLRVARALAAPLGHGRTKPLDALVTATDAGLDVDMRGHGPVDAGTRADGGRGQQEGAAAGPEGHHGAAGGLMLELERADAAAGRDQDLARTDLLARIYWLITSGHRTGFDAERARWVSTSLAEAERHELWDTADSSSDAAKTLWRLERMLNNDRDIRNVDFAAWDLIRAAMLTRCGFAMGWLAEDETWDTLAVLDRALRERYRSWTQVSESFRLARWYWSSESGKDEHFNDLHDLNRSLVLLSPDGPWGIVDWKVATPEPSFLILDDLLDTGMAKPLGAGERKRATQWERWVDDQAILRGQHRPQRFSIHAEQHHRFTKRA